MGIVVFLIGFGIGGFRGGVIDISNRGIRGLRRGIIGIRSRIVGGFRGIIIGDGFGSRFRDGFGNGIRVGNGFRGGCNFGDCMGVRIFLNRDFVCGFGMREGNGVGVEIDVGNFPGFFVD